ncbi:competence protein ComEA [Enterococcus saigonensis]|uniref:Competence protein ComEA n=1 Tax=Enterococcus saigonensis TaxID=1805431 RepID=A0A679II04_9ENTE|nr:helix-hairpin-helix domain-containing protein [Enterococcus saigonensis]BCA85652.1 competence protein ComEA [Enterococcus saigonensis]
MQFFYEQKNRLLILSVVSIFLLIIGGLFIWKKQSDDQPWEALPVASSSNQTKEAKKSNSKDKDDRITVDVKGEVVKPGVYELPREARMQKLIELAGGFTKEAQQKEINLAQKLTDQQMIYVPNQKEVNSINNMVEKEKTENNVTEMVNINTANLTELQTLSGIGIKKAEAIISYREENGNFKAIEELKEVSGIGEKTVEKLRASITI